MNKNKLKTYAQAARREFIEAVTEKAHHYGLKENSIVPCDVNGDFAIINGSAFPRCVDEQRSALEEQVKRKGFDQVMEEVAYTWFNRFAAIRYMELHGFLSHGYRVLSHPEGNSIPEILEKAQHVELAGLDKEEVIKLKMDGTKDEELYSKLLIAECNELSKAIPFLFERVQDYTELLLPDNLLHSDSIIRKLVSGIDEEDWQEIEIIGWLYQFYISEKKDEVIGKVVKSEDIPAATQLFTPNWIVKYLVQNSLGAQWMRTYPDSIIKSKMEYYIEPAEQTDEVNAKVKDITPETLNPEELTLLDPACGSGHILVESYDLLKEIYLERGYRKRDIPELILTKNLFGLEIDDRAAQLAGFAIVMKARGDDRNIFDKNIQPNVVSIQESNEINVQKEFNELVDIFEHAKTFGTLVRVPEELVDKLPGIRKKIEEGKEDLDSQRLWTQTQFYERLLSLITQAEILSVKYDAVVANPPYMGGKGMNALLKEFANTQYAATKSDLFAMFIERGLSLTKLNGLIGFVTPYVWMFISSYERFRDKIIRDTSLTSLIQLEYNAFEPACIPVATCTLARHHVKDLVASFIKLSEFKGHQSQAPRTLEAIKNPGCGWLYRAKPDDFKKIPGSPIGYWVGDRVLNAFKMPKLGEMFPVRSGLTSGDKPRFVRNWSECNLGSINFKAQVDVANSGKWFPHNAGGALRKWYGNRTNVINWESDGRDVRDFEGSTVRSPQYYFRSGVTWTDVSSSFFSARYLPDGSVFENTGSLVVLNGNEAKTVLGFLCSVVAKEMMDIMNPTLHYGVGEVSRLPSSAISDEVGLIDRSSSCVDLARRDWDAYERSWDFQSLPMVIASAEPSPTLESSYTAWITQNSNNVVEMKQLEEENNCLFIDAYGLQDELTPDVPIEHITLTVNPAYRYGGKLTEEEQWTRFRQDTMEELVSYSIGCMMGRYSLDQEGLIYAHSGNLDFDNSKYKTFPADDDGIVPITDHEWFDDDAASRFFRFIETAWDKETLETNLEFVADAIGRKTNESSRDSIRRYFVNGFFKEHLKTYKKRPIYWMFTSGKERAFQALVYLHRYNEGTLSRMRTEYVLPLQGKITTRMEHLEKDKDHTSSTSAANKIQKEIGRLRKQKEELLKFDENLHHYADKKISLDLDDGVKVNYSKFGDLLAEVKAVTGKK
jgi:type II restriction/modification system DNA methylase subunit YeeA